VGGPRKGASASDKEFLDQNGGLSGEIMPDYLHLSAKGYDIWGKAIKADIEKLVR
jgi:lysophospholipase L1-like esterase